MTEEMSSSDKEKEYEKAIDIYNRIIIKICYYFSTDYEEFQDLRQEVLYYIWKGWDNFRNDSKMSTWIYRICFNTCISYQRKERKKRNNVPLEQAMHLEAAKDFKLLDKYRRMHELINQLPYTDRAIILMWLDEKSYEEIALLIGLNRNTVAVRIKRIKEKLIKLSKK